MAYIKSYSNYVLKTRHQLVSDGTVWERDMSTIGGLDQFAPGQVPIYKSGNFIITVRGTHQATNKYEASNWSTNDDGYDWTLGNLSEMTSADGAETDTTLTLKKDFYDFRDFAYYGSLAELLRGSVTDIIMRFPGEMFQTDFNAYYTSSYTEDFEVYEESVVIGGDNYKELSNPFGINAHSQSIHNNGETLGFFANGGYLNYNVITGDTESPIAEWDSHLYVRMIRSREALDEKYGRNGLNDLFYMSFLQNYLDTNYRPLHASEDSDSYLTNEDYFSSYYQEGVAPYPLEWQFLDEERGAVYQEVSKFSGNKWVRNTMKTENYGMETSGSAAVCSNFVNSKVGIAQECVSNNFSGSVIAADNTFVTRRNELYQQLTDGTITQEQYDAQVQQALNAYLVALNTSDGRLANCMAGNGLNYTRTTYSAYVASNTAIRTKLRNVDTYVRRQFVIHECINDPLPEAYVTIICPPGKIGSFKVKTEEGTEYPFTIWAANENRIVYLSSSPVSELRIRPKDEFIEAFYAECDDLQRLLLNPNTTPKYTSTFSVIKENDYGYYRSFEDFTFPTTYGGYNIDPDCNDFSLFAERLGVIGAFYDERFTDNLYRSMTHEAIKNFDWTYTREYASGDEVPYEIGGNKIKKALRLFAREFDEIKSYIDAIQYTNKVTYDQRGNMANYFLTDSLADDGWDVAMVTPISLSELISNTEVSENEVFDDESAQLENSGSSNGNDYTVTRHFYQVNDLEVIPYNNVSADTDDYFVICNQSCNENIGTAKDIETYSGLSSYTTVATDGLNTRYDACKDSIIRAIRSYSADTVFTSLDVNNEFFRRMKLNSLAILRHKGTIEGMEMMLAMFGLKSKRFDNENYDYEITEYSSFAHRIEEKWDVEHQMYRIDWINTTKLIRYDNRFVSRYPYDEREPRVAYQGLPVAYRYEYESAEKPYLCPDGTCSDPDSAYVCDGQPVMRRYLYPSFGQYEEVDGNPYFQMNGGWMASSIVFEKDEKTAYNFQYTREDDVVYNRKLHEGYVEDMVVYDDEPLFKETSYDIMRVETIDDLLSIPQYILNDGIVCYVATIKDDVAVINGEVFPVNSEYDAETNDYKRYVNLVKVGGHVSIGNSLYFYDTVVVYGKDGDEVMYMLSDYPDNFTIKAYILTDVVDDKSYDRFVCKDTYYGDVSADSFTIIYANDTEASNFFMLSDIYSSGKIAEFYDEMWSNGWRRLMKSDYEYKKLSVGRNYFKGNNPHAGRNNYDKGHEYFTYFKRLFRHAADNNLFDERCYDDMYDALEEINAIGFSGLINSEVEVKQYDEYLIEDGKIHYFGNYKPANKDTKSEEKDEICVMVYGDDKDKVASYRDFYCGPNSQQEGGEEEGEDEEEEPIPCVVSGYSLSNSDFMVDGYTGYTEESVKKATHLDEVVIDDVTNQVSNNKRLKIRFMLHNGWGENKDGWYSRDGQSEIKYIDNVIMPYLTQMIPSTAILDVEYYDTVTIPAACDSGNDDEYTEDDGRNARK